MLSICEDFAVEFDILFNAKKTVCLWFHGKRHPPKNEPPCITMNNVQLAWSKTATHLGNIISNDLSEEDEIRYKRSDFISRVNSTIANFKFVPRDICSKIFCRSVVTCMVVRHGPWTTITWTHFMLRGTRQFENSGASQAWQEHQFCHAW